MSIHGLLFQWASTVKIQLNMLFKYKVDLIIISLKINLFSSWHRWKIAELVINNNYSLTHSFVSIICNSDNLIGHRYKFTKYLENIFRYMLFWGLQIYKQELPMVAIFVVRSAWNMKICSRSPTHHSYKVTIHCAS